MKKNNKGFTLAELLIVVAIVAILIAIAIPIYTSAMQDAQMKVNMSNARALKGAATSYILTHWTEEDDSDNDPSTAGKEYSTGADNHGWIAWAAFDENGNMSQVAVRVAGDSGEVNTTHVEDYTADISGTVRATYPSGTITPVPVDDAKSGSVTNPNLIIVHLTGTDIGK